MKGYLPSLSEGRIIPLNWRETYPPLPGDGRPCKSWVFCSITQPNDPPWVQTLTPLLKSTTQNIPPLHLPHSKIKKISCIYLFRQSIVRFGNTCEDNQFEMQLLQQCSIYSKIVVKITIVLQQLNSTNTSNLFFNSDSTYLYTKKLQVCETTKILKNK